MNNFNLEISKNINRITTKISTKIDTITTCLI
jgi:hypothetical protein